MKNVISELYYGNIDPQARGFKNGSFLKKQMAVLSESEAMLTERLTGEEKKAFLSFVNASDVILCVSRSENRSCTGFEPHSRRSQNRTCAAHLTARVTV